VLSVCALALIATGALVSNTSAHTLTFALVLIGVFVLVVMALLNHVLWIWQLLRYSARSNYTRRL